jgi:GH24 family phage-related lysozyme (muramidase)
MLSLHMFRTTDGREATDNEKRTTWHLCKGAYAPNRGAIAYRAITDLRITKDTAMQLCKTRLAREFMPAVEKACPEITAFPAGAIRAIVDIAYNVGIGFARGFPSLIAACNARDWATAAKECTRKDARRRPTDNDMEGLGPRNIWTIARFKEAATQEEDGEEFNRSLNEHS